MSRGQKQPNYPPNNMPNRGGRNDPYGQQPMYDQEEDHYYDPRGPNNQPYYQQHPNPQMPQGNKQRGGMNPGGPMYQPPGNYGKPPGPMPGPGYTGYPPQPNAYHQQPSMPMRGNPNQVPQPRYPQQPNYPPTMPYPPNPMQDMPPPNMQQRGGPAPRGGMGMNPPPGGLNSRPMGPPPNNMLMQNPQPGYPMHNDMMYPKKPPGGQGMPPQGPVPNYPMNPHHQHQPQHQPPNQGHLQGPTQPKRGGGGHPSSSNNRGEPINHQPVMNQPPPQPKQPAPQNNQYTPRTFNQDVPVPPQPKHANPIPMTNRSIPKLQVQTTNHQHFLEDDEEDDDDFELYQPIVRRGSQGQTQEPGQFQAVLQGPSKQLTNSSVRQNPRTTQPTAQAPGGQESVGESGLTAQHEATMKRFNSLDRGTYFIDQSNKSIHFIIDGESDLLGWQDDYLINGYLLFGVVIKITTLTSRLYIFIEREHEIFKNHIKIAEDGKITWNNLSNPENFQIAHLTNVEKVEIFDNTEDGYQGFVCFIVNEDSKLNFITDNKSIQDWAALQRTLLLFEPTSIKKIYLDELENWLLQPESTKFAGKRVAAILNPKVPGETIVYSREKKHIDFLEGDYYVGVIALQYGKYTIVGQDLEALDEFAGLIEKTLDIAEEVDAYVMITNLKRHYDTSPQQKTILVLPSDQTLKVIRYEGQINFEKTKEKLSKIVTM